MGWLLSNTVSALEKLHTGLTAQAISVLKAWQILESSDWLRSLWSLVSTGCSSSTSGLDGFSNEEQRWAFLSDLCVSGSLLGDAVRFREDLSPQSFQSAALKG